MDLGWYPTVLLGSLFWEEALGRLFHLAKCYTSFFFFFLATPQHMEFWTRDQI